MKQSTRGEATSYGDSADGLVLMTSFVTSSYSADSIGYPRTRVSRESSTTKHRLQHTSGPHPIPPPDDPN
ncbi:hypothetical protein F511_38884 [Dorcoceras hygrometricum]|uniref:Uncharacterized protein n=1 Tax=Dorcoceras hygrometricum TaxID=472368 RepID=A0A2Z7AYB1_9LAMI|nr:hypothetical protein F511_38884 [Dorcoceras hygrometricum]